MWINEWVNINECEWMSEYEWMNEWMYKWMNEWMNEWMNDWMNEWMNTDGDTFITKFEIYCYHFYHLILRILNIFTCPLPNCNFLFEQCHWYTK